MAIDANVRNSGCGETRAMDTKSLIIVILAIAVAVLGYMLWDANQTKVRVDLPGIKIEGR
jgi:hypothetical protein